MQLCERCPQYAECMLDYLGKCCKELRRKNCPDVTLTNYERITEMDKEKLAEFLSAAAFANQAEARAWLDKPAEEL